MFCILGAAPAAAATSQLVLEGSIPTTCTIEGTPSSVALGDISGGKVQDAGTIGFRCNLADAGPTVSVTSANRGLKRDGGTELVAYSVRWVVPGTSALENVQASAGTTTAALGAASPGTSRAGTFTITVLPAAVSNAVAGTYRDTITINVAP